MELYIAASLVLTLAALHDLAYPVIKKQNMSMDLVLLHCLVFSVLSMFISILLIPAMTNDLRRAEFQDSYEKNCF